jgi:ribosomal protein S27E
MNDKNEVNEKTFHIKVNPDDRCPECGENRVDYLVWDEDGEYVTCATCGTVYVP